MPALVLQSVASQLSAHALARLAATCVQLRASVEGMHETWREKFVRDFGDAAVTSQVRESASWCLAYRREAVIRCVECSQRTHHVFIPTGARLCSKCERENQCRYRLITRAVACAELGVPHAAFRHSPSVDIKGVRFYVASSLTSFTSACSASRDSSSDSSDDEGSHLRVGAAARRPLKDAAALKAERKANKKAAKLAARQKRADVGEKNEFVWSNFHARPKSHGEHASRSRKACKTPSRKPCATRGNESELELALRDVEKALGQDWQLSLSGLVLADK